MLSIGMPSRSAMVASRSRTDWALSPRNNPRYVLKFFPGRIAAEDFRRSGDG